MKILLYLFLTLLTFSCVTKKKFERLEKYKNYNDSLATFQIQKLKIKLTEIKKDSVYEKVTIVKGDTASLVLRLSELCDSTLNFELNSKSLNVEKSKQTLKINCFTKDQINSLLYSEKEKFKLIETELLDSINTLNKSNKTLITNNNSLETIVKPDYKSRFFLIISIFINILLVLLLIKKTL